MSDQQFLWEKIKDESYCDPSRRMDFVLLFDVKDGNPNGDPDAGNLPRMDPSDRHGIVTDVCIKRKIRDYFAVVLQRPIFIQSQDALNTLYFRAASGVPEAKKHVVELDFSGNNLKEVLTFDKKGTKVEPTDDQLEAVHEWLSLLDVEGFEYHTDDSKLTYFGEAKKKDAFKQLLETDESDKQQIPEYTTERLAIALDNEKKNMGGSKLDRNVRDKVKTKMRELYDDIRLFGAVLTAGTNAGQIRGPMQLTYARSINPILQLDAAITRCAITKESDRGRKETEFGRKPWLSYAAYRQYGFFNAPIADQVTREDLARFWEAIACMFPNSASASKGLMATRDLVVFVHPNCRGVAPSHKLFELINIVEKNKGDPSIKIIDGGKDKLQGMGIDICRPLSDMWPDL